MKVALVDDDKELLSALTELVKGELIRIEDYTNKIFPFNSGEEFLSSWQRGKYDIIILDIYMGDTLGIDVARKIRETDKDVRIVFCTSSNEFASESYEVGAHYYLLKPFNEKGVRTMLERLGLDSYEFAKHVVLSNGQSIILRNVIYTEYYGHIVTLHSKKGDKICARVTHSEVEGLLCENPYFCSPTKGVVVNFYEVKSQNGNNFVMSNGDIVPISRRRAKDVLDAYTKFRFEQTRKELTK
ncbi:MAG: DNA-binding response regulator [Clostridia bacterium]|nr:DNA-binding response regulator [Clostridia bacterium]